MVGYDREANFTLLCHSVELFLVVSLVHLDCYMQWKID